MKLKGTDFARSHMETKGWKDGDGLGLYGQGITDAIKPKLKFDSNGVGHNKADEFEFHWWDHVFNKAAKSITIEDTEGEVKVDFNSDKSELSTKKIRKKAQKKMQKEMKVRLYSNFVKSGTLTGGKMDETEHENDFVEDKDLSKIRTLTDEELVKACGGRTAHKGGRHGHKMDAKLKRIEEAEREFMEKYGQKISNQAQPAKIDLKPVEKKSDKPLDNNVDTNKNIGDFDSKLDSNDLDTQSKKKKKKKRDKHLDNSVDTNKNKGDIDSELDSDDLDTQPTKKKKKKRDKLLDNCGDSNEITGVICGDSNEITGGIGSKDGDFDSKLDSDDLDTQPTKKKKKKRDKLLDNCGDTNEITGGICGDSNEITGGIGSKGDSDCLDISKKSKKNKLSDLEVVEDEPLNNSSGGGDLKIERKKRKKNKCKERDMEDFQSLPKKKKKFKD